MKSTENAKKRLTVSVIDIIIVALALTLIVGIFARYDLIGKLFEKTKLSDATVSFVVEQISENEAALLKEGTKLYCSDGSEFGDVSTAESSASTVYTDGSSTPTVVEGLFDVNGTADVRVQKTENGFFLNGKTFIAAGSVFVLKTPGAEYKVTVLSVLQYKD